MFAFEGVQFKGEFLYGLVSLDDLLLQHGDLAVGFDLGLLQLIFYAPEGLLLLAHLPLQPAVGQLEILSFNGVAQLTDQFALAVQLELHLLRVLLLAIHEL